MEMLKNIGLFFLFLLIVYPVYEKADTAVGGFEKKFYEMCIGLVIIVYCGAVLFLRGPDVKIVDTNIEPHFQPGVPHQVDITVKVLGGGGEFYSLICYGGESFENNFSIEDNETKMFKVDLYGVSVLDKDVAEKFSQAGVWAFNNRGLRLVHSVLFPC